MWCGTVRTHQPAGKVPSAVGADKRGIPVARYLIQTPPSAVGADTPKSAQQTRNAKNMLAFYEMNKNEIEVGRN